ncbi:MAG: type II secretion system minor pseudopilin GspJ [Hydrogenovibrio sp.]|uniref:type II secretion system minor pseudopilin GspJ n=1 Tax=Hydrogenovibrio sp. TaxID=2065821 RepID=UPI00286FD91D|nr:type II secretion system minor pseudopilin GspJ [Hydrogenovibrio sp.]MDR9499546.1 type II secretion system minor pseudopilin GspJ [Hydrogenovibrio sp.]
MKTFQAGFTLIELLVAMAISATVIVLAYQTLDEVISVESRLSTHQKDWQQIESAIGWLEKDLSQLAPRPVKDPLGGARPAFIYRDDLGAAFTRFSQFPSLFESGGLLRVEYRLEQGQLVRVIWPVLDVSPGVEPITMVLADNLDSWQWRFMDNNKNWQTSWPSGELGLAALPVATELTLKFKQRGEIKRVWLGPGGL